MKALTSCSSQRLLSIPNRAKDGGFLPSRDVLIRRQIRLFGCPKGSAFGLSHSVSLQHTKVYPILWASAVSYPDTRGQTPEGIEQTPNEDIGQSKTVRVKFQLQRECSFGQQFFIVGDDLVVGLWEPSNAIPLNWSDGHLWIAELDIPVGKSIKFKFILKGETEHILWQPGPDRLVEAWETEKTITIFEDWDNPELQKIIEEEQDSSRSGKPADDFQLLMTAENLSQPVGSPITDVEDDSVEINVVTSLHEESNQEKPIPIVAENITEPMQNPNAANKNVPRPIGGGKNSVSVSNTEVGKVGGSSKGNGRTLIAEKLYTRNKGLLVFSEELPVLVPGLTPGPHRDESSLNTVENDVVTLTDTSLGSEDTENPNLLELDMEEKPSNGSLQEITEAKICCDKQEPSEQIETERMLNSEGALHRLEQVRPESYEDLNEQPNSKQNSGFMENDLLWGRRTIQKFLATLGLL